MRCRFDDGDPIAKQAWQGIGAGLGFVERNQQFYENARPIADIALYYSHTTRVLTAPESQEAAGQWQTVAQTFYQAGIPVGIVTDEALIREGAKSMLSKVRMIVLLGISSLSDEEIAVLREYVAPWRQGSRDAGFRPLHKLLDQETECPLEGRFGWHEIGVGRRPHLADKRWRPWSRE